MANLTLDHIKTIAQSVLASATRYKPNLSVTDPDDPRYVVGAEKLSNRVDKVEGSVSGIGGRVTTLEMYEDETYGIANAAQTAATNAQTTADNAQTTADNAQTTANAAKTAATNAQTTADAAKTAATNAQTTADAAETAAATAQTTADAAKTAATNAQTTADAAETAANVKPDWSISDSTQGGYILNRPLYDDRYTEEPYFSTADSVRGTYSELSWICRKQTSPYVSDYTRDSTYVYGDVWTGRMQSIPFIDSSNIYVYFTVFGNASLLSAEMITTIWKEVDVANSRLLSTSSSTILADTGEKWVSAFAKRHALSFTAYTSDETSIGSIRVPSALKGEIVCLDAKYLPLSVTDGIIAAQTAAANAQAGVDKLNAEYTLIESITLDEDVASVVRTAEPDGTAYDFDAVYIKLTSPEYTEDRRVYFSVGNTDAEDIWTADRLAYCSFADIINTQGYSTDIFAEKSHGLFHGTYYKAGSEAVVQTPYSNNAENRTGTVKAVRIFAYSNTTDLIPAGTKIDIYGVRT